MQEIVPVLTPLVAKNARKEERLSWPAARPDLFVVCSEAAPIRPIVCYQWKHRFARLEIPSRQVEWVVVAVRVVLLLDVLAFYVAQQKRLGRHRLDHKQAEGATAIGNRVVVAFKDVPDPDAGLLVPLLALVGGRGGREGGKWDRILILVGSFCFPGENRSWRIGRRGGGRHFRWRGV